MAALLAAAAAAAESVAAVRSIAETEQHPELVPDQAHHLRCLFGIELAKTSL